MIEGRRERVWKGFGKGLLWNHSFGLLKRFELHLPSGGLLGPSVPTITSREASALAAPRFDEVSIVAEQVLIRYFATGRPMMMPAMKVADKRDTMVPTAAMALVKVLLSPRWTAHLSTPATLCRLWTPITSRTPRNLHWPGQQVDERQRRNGTSHQTDDQRAPLVHRQQGRADGDWSCQHRIGVEMSGLTFFCTICAFQVRGYDRTETCHVAGDHTSGDRSEGSRAVTKRRPQHLLKHRCQPTERHAKKPRVYIGSS